MGESSREPSNFASALLPPLGGKLRARLERVPQRLWLVVLLPLVWWTYRFYLSAGGLEDWPIYGSFHDLQADGFRAGQLNLPLTPAPELLAAKDPYDRVNIRYWPLDVSYYKGKFYTYWGPVPALFLALGKALLGVHRAVGDQYVAYFFMCLASGFGALLVERMARRLFPSLSWPYRLLGALALVFANPALHAAATAGTYYTSIVAGQAWILLGLVLSFDAVWHAGTSRASRFRFLGAGVAFGLAIASRVSLAPAILVFTLVTAAADALPSPRRLSRFVGSALYGSIPVCAIALALLVYNKVRFEDFFEFGTSVQLSGFPLFRLSGAYLFPNLYSYVLRPFETSCQFPYLYQVWSMGAAAFPWQIKLPPDYMVLEPVVGWLVAVPLTWLIPLALPFAPRPFRLASRTCRTYLWCAVSFTTLATCAGAIAMGLYLATMRYLHDVTYGLVLLSVLSGYALCAGPFGRKAPRLTASIFTVLVAASVVVGALLGYQGYGGQFRTHNRALDKKLVGALSLCGQEKPRVPKFHPW